MQAVFEILLAPSGGRRALPVAIGDSIADLILAGKLRPGDKLPTEAAFTQKYGVGRNSYREAIKMLSSIGIVEIRRGEGTFITKSLNPAAVISPLVLQLALMQDPSSQIVELRLLLEIGATELVLDKLREGDLEKLMRANERLLEESRISAHDQDELLRRDLQFHEVLIDLTGNQLLKSLYMAVSKLFAASVRQSVNQSPRIAYDNHSMIIEALRSGDVERVRRATKQSFDFWSDVLAAKGGDVSEA